MSGVELIQKIDFLYTTSSNELRRTMMDELNQFFQKPEAWQVLFQLFATALEQGGAETGAFRKRRARVCFFAANALLAKIKRQNASLTVEQRAHLAQNVHGLLFAKGEHVPIVRDAQSAILGRACTKRLILALATLTCEAELQAYVAHACALLSVRNDGVEDIGLEMLLVVAGGGEEEGEEKDQESGVEKDAIARRLPLLQALATKMVLPALEQVFLASPSVLKLDTLHAWLVVLGDTPAFATQFPRLFRFALDSISQIPSNTTTAAEEEQDAGELVRTSSSLLQLLAETTPATAPEIKNELGLAIMRTRNMFAQEGEDVQQALASALAQICESDCARIASRSNAQAALLLDYALEVLQSTSSNRSAVSKNMIDFFLLLLDLAAPEREVCIRILLALLHVCEFSTGVEEEDVELFRASGDGPADLFAALYLALPQVYLNELTQRVVQSQSEVALFALRCAGKEICEDGEVGVLQIFAHASAVVGVGAQRIREEYLCAIGEFAPLMDPITALAMLEYVVHALDWAACAKQASVALVKLSRQHAKTYAPHVLELIQRVLFHTKALVQANTAKRVGEALVRIAAGASASESMGALLYLLENYLRAMTRDGLPLQLIVLAQMIKVMPVDEAMVCQTVLKQSGFWQFWELVFAPPFLGGEDEDVVSAASELVTQCMRFGGGTILLAGAERGRLDQVLNWAAQALQRHGDALPCIGELLANSIERSSALLSSQDCGKIIYILFTHHHNNATTTTTTRKVLLDALRKALMYHPAAVFDNHPLVTLDAVCDFLIHKELDRDGNRLLLDMLTRTRRVQGEPETAWTIYSNALDAVLLRGRLERIAANALAWGDDADHLLFWLLRYYPTSSSSIHFLDPRLREAAQPGRDPEAFRRLFKTLT